MGNLNMTIAELNEFYAEKTEEIGVSAYVRSASVTCTLADTYYPIETAFTNEILDGFTLDAANFRIVYNSTRDRAIEIMQQVSTQSSKNGAVLTFAVLINGTPYTMSESDREFATGTSGSLLSLSTPVLTAGDTVQIAVSSDIAANDISMLNITTTAKRFL
jgi:hypothetical protein